MSVTELSLATISRRAEPDPHIRFLLAYEFTLRSDGMAATQAATLWAESVCEAVKTGNKVGLAIDEVRRVREAHPCSQTVIGAKARDLSQWLERSGMGLGITRYTNQ